MKLQRSVRASVMTLAFAVLVASGAIASFPKVSASLQSAWSLRDLSWSRRRETVLGPAYPAIRALRRQIPETSDVAIILADADDVGPGTFLNYYLYPRTSIIYWGPNNYDQQILEGRVDRPRPATIIWLDSTRSPVPRLATIEEVRQEWETKP
jgi:hypothetical protein